MNILSAEKLDSTAAAAITTKCQEVYYATKRSCTGHSLTVIESSIRQKAQIGHKECQNKGHPRIITS